MRNLKKKARRKKIHEIKKNQKNSDMWQGSEKWKRSIFTFICRKNPKNNLCKSIKQTLKCLCSENQK